MISITKAIEAIEENSKPFQTQKVAVNDAASFYLPEDVLAPISMPPFSQSAMDGYAVYTHNEKKEFTVVGEIKAGDGKQIELLKNN